jgi:hypothetical protein
VIVGRGLGGKGRALRRYFGMDPMGPPEQFDVVVAQHVVHLIEGDIGIRANEIAKTTTGSGVMA